MAWYDEWTALVPILETMQMAECQRCRELRTELNKQELEHSNDEIDWWAALVARDVVIDGLNAKIREQDQQLATAQMQSQQQQQQLDAMREQLQAQHNERLRMDRGITFDLTNIQH